LVCSLACIFANASPVTWSTSVSVLPSGLGAARFEYWILGL